MTKTIKPSDLIPLGFPSCSESAKAEVETCVYAQLHYLRDIKGDSFCEIDREEFLEWFQKLSREDQRELGPYGMISSHRILDWASRYIVSEEMIVKFHWRYRRLV